MFAVIQFPIADGRSFVERRGLGGAQAENGRVRLGRPDFSNLKWDPPPDYLRYFGRAVERKRGKQSAWFDEQASCRADRAIRFVKLHRHPLAADSIALPPACAFRGFFGDGMAVSRMEAGVRAPSDGSVTGLTGAQCRDLVTAFMLLPTRVRALGAERARTPVYQASAPLVRQGIHLAKLYGRATAAKLTDEELTARSRLVKHGLPPVIVEFEAGEADHLPEDAHVVDPAAVGGAHLAFSYVQYSKDDRTPTWFLRPGTADAEQLRNPRLVLPRLHGQRQVLNLVLTQVLESVVTFRPETESGKRLNDYLNAAMTYVQKPGSHGGVSRSELWKAIDDAETAEAAVGARRAPSNWCKAQSIVIVSWTG